MRTDIVFGVCVVSQNNCFWHTAWVTPKIRKRKRGNPASPNPVSYSPLRPLRLNIFHSMRHAMGVSCGGSRLPSIRDFISAFCISGCDSNAWLRPRGGRRGAHGELPVSRASAAALAAFSCSLQKAGAGQGAHRGGGKWHCPRCACAGAGLGWAGRTPGRLLPGPPRCLRCLKGNGCDTGV